MNNYEFLTSLLHAATLKQDLEKQHRRLAYNLAYLVMHKLSIQNDRTLIAILGEGHEYTNHEALLHWMLERYSRESYEAMDDIAVTVTKDLYCFLDDELNDGGFSC